MSLSFSSFTKIGDFFGCNGIFLGQSQIHCITVSLALLLVAYVVLTYLSVFDFNLESQLGFDGLRFYY